MKKIKIKYTNKTEWTTHLGNTVTVEGMADAHVANAIQFLTHYQFNNDFLKVLKKEAKRRKLTKEYLERAQFPYKDGKGNWIIWDFKTDNPKVIGSYLRG